MSDADKFRRRIVAVLWIVALTPTWVAIVAHPVGFWEVQFVGCLQLVAGGIALGITGLLYE